MDEKASDVADREYRIAVGVLLGAIFAVFTDAALPGFEVATGFWTTLAALAAFLGARAAIKGGR